MGLNPIPHFKKKSRFCFLNTLHNQSMHNFTGRFFRLYVINVFSNGFENVSHHLFWLLVPHLSRGKWFCLFVLGFSSLSRIVHSYADVTIASEGLQILIMLGTHWPLSSNVSLAFHTYGDVGHQFIMVIFDDPRHSYLLPLGNNLLQCKKCFWYV